MRNFKTGEHLQGSAATVGWVQRQSRLVYPCSRLTFLSVFRRTTYLTSSALYQAKLSSKSSKWNRQSLQLWIKSHSPYERCSWSVCRLQKEKVVPATWLITRPSRPCDCKSLSTTLKGAARSLSKAYTVTQSSSKLSSLSSESSFMHLSNRRQSRVGTSLMEADGRVDQGEWLLQTQCKTRTLMRIMNCASASTLRRALSTRSTKFCPQTSML